MALVYSCCFWFSLRLGGILIGIFSLFQAVLVLCACCLGYNNAQTVKDEIAYWSNGMVLMYAKSYLDNLQEDPKKFFSLGIGFTSIFMVACVIFIYGAYMCSNILMIAYIIMEFIRLILVSILIATSLLLIKQNTMDIGVLIGASVAGGFFLLGLFYLWLCAANLPIVIKETESEDQASVIDQLRKMLEINNPRMIPHSFHIDFDPEPSSKISGRPQEMFMVPPNKNVSKSKTRWSPTRMQPRIPKSYPWQY